ncbi:hypothetical protein JCM17380_16250 [Desulfosporosinus burensis]
MKRNNIKHQFVSVVPEKLEEGVVYISIQYNTVLHLCACGCGEEVVTPLAPNDWYLTYNGQSISLYPSIGNWSYKCKSHYWIRDDRVVWAETWTDNKIQEARKREKKGKDSWFKRLFG